MLLGRPINLWLGFVTAAAGLISVALISAGVDPTLVANVTAASVGVLGALIVLVANQPPTVTSGDTIKVVTPAGEPNETRIVA